MPPDMVRRAPSPCQKMWTHTSWGLALVLSMGCNGSENHVSGETGLCLTILCLPHPMWIPYPARRKRSVRCLFSLYPSDNARSNIVIVGRSKTISPEQLRTRVEPLGIEEHQSAFGERRSQAISQIFHGMRKFAVMATKISRLKGRMLLKKCRRSASASAFSTFCHLTAMNRNKLVARPKSKIPRNSTASRSHFSNNNVESTR